MVAPVSWMTSFEELPEATRRIVLEDGAAAALRDTPTGRYADHGCCLRHSADSGVNTHA
ncbi:hypothetical protein XFF6166_660003 [Xanthomonas citri pv. fuscans]|nr:hypothetical protein XFF6166_660003 [Xanthomonas citri pv. fuscans]SOO02467.1 hypothetical protein XFF6960_630004 [Xanthomonas citri pv. fuscans]SOO05895.1 hypothetical protein XFF7767_510004 [Xanthomonas citri pv. fuscans]SOO09630.1 hypothetical protein XFF6970_440003 [Xanthomonas citri pv. fuscans]SOO15170.1 hypothetical protein XFF7766_50004 [Xanthomonas citri pv. fuscans]